MDSFLVDNKIKTSSRIRKISVIKQFFNFLYDESFIHIVSIEYQSFLKNLKVY